uniref:SFRICE_024361 n=1 Tax=Spodoptera frugiperda TaxID=7108 RepID=A0A2H1WKJ2_SPOFR
MTVIYFKEGLFIMSSVRSRSDVAHPTVLLVFTRDIRATVSADPRMTSKGSSRPDQNQARVYVWIEARKNISHRTL